MLMLIARIESVSDRIEMDALCAKLGITNARMAALVEAGALPRPRLRGDRRTQWDWIEVERSEFVRFPERFAAPSPTIVGIDRVYFVGMQDLIKIGYSAALKQRIAQLQDTIPYPIKLLHDIAGDKALEAILHHRFRHLHFRGEWFQRAPELLAYIEHIKAGGDVL